MLCIHLVCSIDRTTLHLPGRRYWKPVNWSWGTPSTQHGYNHWASGCLSHLELNYKHSLFCHIRCFMTPSMKSGVYHMYVLLTVEGEVCSIKKEMCCWVATYVLYVSLNLKFNFIFNCRKSTTCTHVFGLFHTLVSLAPAQFQAMPSTTDDIELPLPITLYTYKWKVSRKRKESNMKMSDGLFEKHTHSHE